jgi:anti-anti-sigma factor
MEHIATADTALDHPADEAGPEPDGPEGYDIAFTRLNGSTTGGGGYVSTWRRAGGGPVDARPRRTAVDHVATADIAFDRTGPELVVDIVGELDSSTAPECGAKITEQIRPGDETIWLDLRCVSVCTSAGVAMIAKVHNAALDRGGHAVVYRPSTEVLRVLQMCTLDDRLRIRTA